MPLPDCRAVGQAQADCRQSSPAAAAARNSGSNAESVAAGTFSHGIPDGHRSRHAHAWAVGKVFCFQVLTVTIATIESSEVLTRGGRDFTDIHEGRILLAHYSALNFAGHTV